MLGQLGVRETHMKWINGVAGRRADQSAISVNCFEGLSRIHGFLLWSMVSLGALACRRHLHPKGEMARLRIGVIAARSPERRGCLAPGCSTCVECVRRIGRQIVRFFVVLLFRVVIRDSVADRTPPLARVSHTLAGAGLVLAAATRPLGGFRTLFAPLGQYTRYWRRRENPQWPMGAR
jgi:hypothetical protein